MQSYVQFNPNARGALGSVQGFLGKAGMELRPSTIRFVYSLHYSRDGRPAKADESHVASLKAMAGVIDVYHGESMES